jgi:hypothetical protein
MMGEVMIPNWHRMRQLVLLVLLLDLAAQAQSTESKSGQSQPQPPEGWESGGYRIHQAIELGVRVSDTSGSNEMYDTLVNLHTGPRVLDQSLSMQSSMHDGLLFDNLFINSFGWGGDANNGLRARVDKSTWYNFQASFRRDQNYFDYNLLANPLNPPTSSPNVPVPSSPHIFATTRRMTDLDLTFLPQSIVSFRVGYSHNNMTGSSNSSVHEGTDALLFQPWNTTLNSYRFGADFKLLPRTVISYDQFLDYYKGDTSWQLGSFVPALLPGTAGSVELGLPIDTVNKNPCAINPPATSLIDPSGTLTNITCNGYFNYNRTDRVRTSMPTERLSLHSRYFQRLELSASYAYSSADMNSPFDEFFNGLISRSRIRQETVTGPAKATRISNVADFTATVHLSEHLRVVDTFRLWDYRIPESFNSTETDWIVPGSGSCALPSCSLLIPISDLTPTMTNTFDQKSLNQSWKRNQVDLVWDASKHFGGRIGFRYGNRLFHHVNDFTTGDEDTIRIHEYTPLLGFWAKPITGLRFNFDWEHTNNDDAIVRLGPRKEARYRIQTNYTPRPWAVLGGSINLWETSNADALTNYRGHNRNYGFTATLTPRERYGVDFAYNYNAYQQSAFVCFNDSDTTLPVVANAGSCQANGYNDSNNPLLTYGSYTSGTHYAMGSVMFKPVPRVTTQLGYSITSVTGQTPQFNSLQPPGSLQYNYHQPLAYLAIDIGHNLTAKAGWNYYQYGEQSFVGPTSPRNFHANNETFSLRWAF